RSFPSLSKWHAIICSLQDTKFWEGVRQTRTQTYGHKIERRRSFLYVRGSCNQDLKLRKRVSSVRNQFMDMFCDRSSIAMEVDYDDDEEVEDMDSDHDEDVSWDVVQQMLVEVPVYWQRSARVVVKYCDMQ
ncbi:LOW QUALITY PROTEIN: hypothetical protein M8C21_006989, partial [Ambrosia artemisiifolia]